MNGLRRSIIVLIVCLTVGLGLPGDADAHTGPPPPSPSSKVPPSLEELAFSSDAIVVASLQSIEMDVEVYLGQRDIPGKTSWQGIGIDPHAFEIVEFYRPIQVLTFQVDEYLKGSGPSTLLVEVPMYGDSYGSIPIDEFVSLQGALQHVETTIRERNATWDDRPGILFLVEGNVWGAREFYLSVDRRVEGAYLYTVDSLNKAWLPGAVTGPDPQEFIFDVNEFPPVTVSRKQVEDTIAEMVAAQTSNIPGYADCVRRQIYDERDERGRLQEGTPREFRTWDDIEVESGLPKGAVIYYSPSESKPSNKPSGDLELYWGRHWLAGPDADLFSFAGIEDPTPDDKYFAKGRLGIITTRPLPKGTYKFTYYDQYEVNMTCDYISPTDYYQWTITVTGPSGTLHEAFFDPTDAGTNDISPAKFSPMGDAKIESLEWRDGKVVLALSAYMDLGEYTLDIIALDGSVALSLPVSDAAIDEESGTFSWDVAEQPWEYGDKLMLRIWRDG